MRPLQKLQQQSRDENYQAMSEALTWLSSLIDEWDNTCSEKGCRCTYMGSEDCSQPAQEALSEAWDALERLFSYD